MKQIHFILLSVFILFQSCGTGDEQETKESDDEQKPIINQGIWRAVLTTQGQELPFNFEITKKGDEYFVEIINGEERLEAGNIKFKPEVGELSIPMHYFDAEIYGKYTEDRIEGFFIKNFADDYLIPLVAEFGKDYRFDPVDEQENKEIEGKWDVTFYKPSEDNRETHAIGIFESSKGKATGTFLTPTGDYRYLGGNTTASGINLSAFDGEHSYLFTAELQEDGSLKGEYFSGKGGYKTWIGIKNENAELPKEDLTFLKEGYDEVNFELPDLEGNLVTLDDEKYQNKVILLQIFGSWCPNCMDETNFLAPWYDRNKDRGVEIIGISYENKADFDYASKRVKKMIERLNVKYDFVLGGSRKQSEASATLPMLNKVFAFPTTIFIDRSGKVRKIHTGFSGPGTGVYYEEWVEEFNRFMDSLLDEPA